MLHRVRFVFPLVACLILGQAWAFSQEKGASEPITGLRVFTCGHSFHVFVPGIVADLAKKANVQGHTQVGLSSIGGSRVIQHWDKDDNKAKDKKASDKPADNLAKKVLREGKADVLTLSPIFLPDVGIENFVKLALENNPKIRITIQENWLPFDMYEPTFTERPKTVDHNAPTVESLKKMHAPYFQSIDAHVIELNKKYQTNAVYVAPVGQAVIALREKIIAGKAPGLKEQSDLFTDAIGHATAPLRVLVGYTHFASIYQRSPVGLPMPAELAKLNSTDGEKLNRLLQEIAWEAVTAHPLSGVKGEFRPR